MKLSHRDQLIVLGAVTVLVSVAAVFLLIMPQFRQISRMDGEIGQARSEILDAKTLVARRQEAKKEAAVTEAELLDLANSIPESPELPSLIIELQDTANDSGVQFSKMSPATDLLDEEGGYRTAAIGLQMHGRWADFVHFFQKLQRIDRQVRVVDIVVTNASEGADGESSADDEPRLQADLTIEVYTMAEDGAAAGAAPPPPAPTPAGQ